MVDFVPLPKLSQRTMRMITYHSLLRGRRIFIKVPILAVDLCEKMTILVMEKMVCFLAA